MNLKLFLEQTGQSWTLKQGKAYTIGSGQDCDIILSQFSGIINQHLRLSFDPVDDQSWVIENLSSSIATFINGQTQKRAIVQREVVIQLAPGVILTAKPEALAIAAPNVYAPASQGSAYSTETVRNPGFREVVKPYTPHSQPSLINSDELPTLSWSQYVQSQIAHHEHGIMRLATSCALLTGWRNTPWLKSSQDQGGLCAFEGYIIPDFKGSVEAVVQSIEKEIGELRQYDDTDCFAANLTDAHIADSASQSFLGVELFPIQRGRNVYRSDYRRFCVASYHRIRTYLLIEKYGSDLFVSWVTRFEPIPTPAVMQLWFVVALLLSVLTLSSGKLGLITAPFAIWSSVYLAVPYIMGSLNILPKRANANLVLTLVLIAALMMLSVMSFF
jgi:Inner membrane component of T3SS, cytoplasmic domain